MKIQENIRYYREENGYLQKDLAKLIFVSERTIGHYETGERVPPIDKLYAIANALDVEVNDLLYDNKRTEEDWWHHYFQNRRIVKKNMDERSFKLMMKRTYPEEYSAMKETEDTIEIYKYIFSKSLAQTILPLCDENTYLCELYHSEEDGWFISGYTHNEYFSIKLRERRKNSGRYKMDVYDIENPTVSIVSKIKQIAKIVRNWFIETYPESELDYTLDALIFLSNDQYEELLQGSLRPLYSYLHCKTTFSILLHAKCRTIGDFLNLNCKELVLTDEESKEAINGIEYFQEKLNRYVNLANK